MKKNKRCGNHRHGRLAMYVHTAAGDGASGVVNGLGQRARNANASITPLVYMGGPTDGFLKIYA